MPALQKRPLFLLESLERRLLLTTYYVSLTGSDAAAGSSAAPFATLQHGVSVLNPGDTLSVKAGTYSTGFIVGYDPAGSSVYGVIAGTPSAPITIQADPAASAGSVIITGGNSKTQVGIDLEPGCDYLVINGFVIDGTAKQLSAYPNKGSGIKATGNYDTIENCTVKNIDYGFGITCDAAIGIQILNNEVFGTGWHNNGNYGHGIYVAGASNNCVVRGNYVHDNLYTGIQFNGDPDNVTGAIVEQNRVMNNGGNGFNCDGLRNSTIQNNLITGWQNFGMVLFHIDAALPSTGNLIINNTFAHGQSGSAAALRLLNAATGNRVINNILLGGDGNSFRISSDSQSGLLSDSNVVGSFQSEDTGATQTLSQWRTATGQDTHSFVASEAALFVSPGSDYHLLSGGPAVDAGTSLPPPNQPPLYDLDKNPRPAGSAWDIGAYEYQAPLTIPAAPSTLSATPVDPLSIALTWIDNSANETSFLIERSPDGINFTQIASVGSNVTSYTDTGRTPGVTYTYRVRAANAAGNSGYSNTSSAIGPAVPATPAAPSNLTAAQANGYALIALSWADNSNNETGFLIERSPDGVTFTQIASVGASVTGYTDSGLTPNTMYWYRVRATNSGSNSAYSNTASATAAVGTGPYSLWGNSVVPANPNDADTSATEVGIKFRSDIAGSITGIRFYKGNLNTGTHTAHLWTDTGTLLATATFTGETASGWQTVTFSQPVNVQGSTVYVASYYAPNGHYADDAGVFSISGVDSAPLHALADGVDGANGAYAYGPNGTFPNNAYQSDNYYVDVVFSPQSASVTLPLAPSGLLASAVSSSQINLSWTDNSSNETGFLIERSPDGVTFTQIASVGSNVTTYNDTGLLAGTQYLYRVRSANSAGNSSYSNTASATTSTGASAPAAPSGLSTSVISSTQINLSWTDNSSNETGFTLQRALGSGSFSTLATLTANATSYSDTGLSPATSYRYRVMAVNGAGNSTYSNTASATTSPGATAPAAPSALSAVTASSTEIDLSWTDNSTNETGFTIERALGSGSFSTLTTLAANATGYSDTGLSASTSYRYRVMAVNGAGNSAYSNTASATTSATPSANPPAAPSGLTIVASTDTEIDLSWNNNSSVATSVLIERSTDGVNFTQIAAVAASTTNYSDIGLAPSTQYTYRVRAAGSSANSVYSATVSGLTSGPSINPQLAYLYVPLSLGGAKTLRFTGSNGAPSTIAVAGPGSYVVHFGTPGLSVSIVRGVAVVAGGEASVDSITATGTTGASKIAISTSGHTPLTLGGLSSDGSFGVISARPVVLIGELAVAGSIRQVTFASLQSAAVSAESARSIVIAGSVNSSTVTCTALNQFTMNGVFSNSFITAQSLGAANLGTLQIANQGVQFGVTAHTLNSLSAKFPPKKRIHLAHLASSSAVLTALTSQGLSGDFEVTLD